MCRPAQKLLCFQHYFKLKFNPDLTFPFTPSLLPRLPFNGAFQVRQRPGAGLDVGAPAVAVRPDDLVQDDLVPYDIRATFAPARRRRPRRRRRAGRHRPTSSLDPRDVGTHTSALTSTLAHRLGDRAPDDRAPNNHAPDDCAIRASICATPAHTRPVLYVAVTAVIA